jgi:hypothetical protein
VERAVPPRPCGPCSASSARCARRGPSGHTSRRTFEYDSSPRASAGQQRQRREAARHAHMLTSRAHVEPDAPVQPVSARAEAIAPRLPPVGATLHRTVRDPPGASPRDDRDRTRTFSEEHAQAATVRLLGLMSGDVAEHPQHANAACRKRVERKVWSAPGTWVTRDMPPHAMARDRPHERAREVHCPIPGGRGRLQDVVPPPARSSIQRAVCGTVARARRAECLLVR